MAAAPPFVAYSTMSDAVVPASEWPYLYASLQAYKAHVQEYPGCQKMELFAAVDGGGGGMRIHCSTVWDTPEQLDAFLELGYTFERLVADLELAGVERSLVMEKLF